MSKRILILTDNIAPPAFAPRVVSLCRYLSDQGYVCAVFSDREAGVQPFSMPFGQWYQTAYYASNNRLRYIADKVFGARERHFQTCIESTIDVSQYDLIFCSTCYYFPLQTTYRLAKKYHKPYIVDLRDIAEQFGQLSYRTHSLSRWKGLNNCLHRLFTAHNLRQRNRVLANARHVITISPWHRDLLSRYNPSTNLIYNGFDEQEFKPQDIPSDKFIISYAGKIYDLHFRDPRLLFEALQQMLSQKQMNPEDIELVFHIDQGSIGSLETMVKEYKLEPLSHISGYIPRTELLPLLHRSSVLLVLTCKSTPEGSHGIMGTKFYEALGVEKPVLCIRSDEECLAQVIHETHAGLAGEKVQEVADFLLDRYKEWKQKGFTRQAVNPETKQHFSRQYQTQQMEELILQTITPPTISVIVPVYNAAPYLSQCLDSLLNQTYPHWQAILLDDASTDESASILKQYSLKDPRFTFLSLPHRGQAATRNEGLRHIQGTYVTFLDADDRLEEHCLETLLRHIGDKDVVQSGFQRFDSRTGQILKTMRARHFYRLTSACARLYKRTFLKSHSLSFPEGHFYEDVIFSMNLWAARPSYTIVPYCGYLYRLNEHSTTSAPHDEDRQWLFRTIRQGAYPLWLKLLTLLRLRMHYRKLKHK